MAIDKPEPYDTLYPNTNATARNQRIEIDRLTAILAALGAVSTTIDINATISESLSFEALATRQLNEEIFVLLREKLNITLEEVLRGLLGSNAKNLTDVVNALAETLIISGSVVVTATDLDIRNLAFATDKVDVTGSAVTVSASALPANAAQESGGNLDDINSAVTALTTVDYATEAKQDIGNASLAAIDTNTDNLDVALSTRASEATLETLATEETLAELLDNESDVGGDNPEAVARRLAELTYIENYKNSLEVLLASESRGVSTRGVELR